MVKIHIAGNSGSGKTTLAHELGRSFDIPVFGLDNIVWQSGWIKTPQSIRIDKEMALASKTDWIIEGVSPRIRQAADIVVFLDVSRPTSFRRSMTRNLEYLFRSRPELPEGCPEFLFLPQQMKFIWRFSKHTRPALLEGLRLHQGRVLIVRTPAQF